MKKIVTLLVSFLVLVSLTACGSSAPSGTLTIGVPPMTGDFLAGWSNSAYDVIVRDLIYGYPTYDYTDGGEFVLNETVVKEEVVTENDDGSKTYTFTIHDDLKWNDGEKITAKDFVFDLLVTSSREFAAVEGANTGANRLVGWEAYGYTEEEVAELAKEGSIDPDFAANFEEKDTFDGVALVDEMTFSLTIKAEELPYFHEVTLVAAAPSPMHVWAPGADIEDGASKVTFGGDTADMAAVTEYISKTERFAPTVTAGMYTFEGYENEVVTLKVNPEFKGDYRGHKPTIETVEIKRVNETLAVDYVLSGDIDITTGVVEGEKIEKALEAVEAGNAGVTTYERNGYGYLGFHNDFGPVADYKVRQALGFLIDRNEFVDGILGGYGVIVHGEYGLGQWMYKDNAEYIEENFINYVYDPDKAAELLDEAGWNKNDAGGDYDGTGFRYNADGDKLVLNHAGSENNLITDLIANDVVSRFEKAGIEFNVDYLDFNVMLNYFYYPEATQTDAFGARKYHSFNLASTFTAAWDPYTSYHSDYLGTWYNTTQTNDPVFDDIVTRLRAIDPSDRDLYSATWLEFQEYWNEQLPTVPLYSNQYYDIYGAQLENVNTTPFYSIGRALIDIKLK